MRDPEQQRVALECLRLVVTQFGPTTPSQLLGVAESFYLFVTGDDADGAKAKLEAVREVVG